MKISIHALIFSIFFFSLTSYSQAPQGIPYQAIARNSSGAILSSTLITVRFTIRDSIATGTIKYRETHNVTTSDQAMFSVNIGQGTPVIGTFSGINWGSNAKFLQVEMDPVGGSSYIEMGTTQMMSVPYSLYSGSSQTSSNCFTHYVGEVWGGGVVFHVYRGEGGLEHGLIVSKNDLGSLTVWSNIAATSVGSPAQSPWDGASNSVAIVSQTGHSSSSAKLCVDYVSGGYSDWFLPSIDQLRTLKNERFDVNRALSSISGATQLIPDGYYWSSTESNATLAWVLGCNNADGSFVSKNNTNYVRAIRSF